VLLLRKQLLQTEPLKTLGIEPLNFKKENDAEEKFKQDAMLYLQRLREGREKTKATWKRAFH
jgi:hypothetical protein